MGQDKYGNYLPTLPPLAPHIGGKFGTLTFGSGAPVGNPTTFQAAYVDTVGGVMYVNEGGAWVALSGGGGGSVQVFSGAGQPSVVLPNPGVTNAVYTDTLTGNHWYYYGGGWH